MINDLLKDLMLNWGDDFQFGDTAKGHDNLLFRVKNNNQKFILKIYDLNPTVHGSNALTFERVEDIVKISNWLLSLGAEWAVNYIQTKDRKWLVRSTNQRFIATLMIDFDFPETDYSKISPMNYNNVGKAMRDWHRLTVGKEIDCKFHRVNAFTKVVKDWNTYSKPIENFTVNNRVD